MSTPTPLVNALQDAFNADAGADPIAAYCELADFARRLETELAQAQAREDEWRGAFDSTARQLAASMSDCADAMAERDTAVQRGLENGRLATFLQNKLDALREKVQWWLKVLIDARRRGEESQRLEANAIEAEMRAALEDGNAY